MTGPTPPTLPALARRAGGLALPLLAYPGIQLTGASMLDVVREPAAQADCILAAFRRFGMAVLLTGMDLSVEAEAFGATVHFPAEDVPQVLGRRVTSEAEARALAVPPLGMARTAHQLDVVRRLATAQPGRLILAGVTGPFSLAARLLGVQETLLLTHDSPGTVRAVVARCAEFLAAYVHALRGAGAGGVIMAEPTAGLLSPDGMAAFASGAVSEIRRSVEDPDFTLVLHCCSARLAHLPALVASGAPVLHVGRPMDLGAALGRVPREVWVSGNLDPAGLFLPGPPEAVAAAVRALRQRARGHRNFILSSGCELPARTPLPHLQAFFEAAAEPAAR